MSAQVAARPSWDPFLARPGASALFADFDGTLAELVEDPEVAAPAEGVVALLARLASSMATVGVLSGRPVSFLERHLPPSVLMVGLDGLEVLERGVRSDHPLCGSWREAVADVAVTALGTGPAGMRVEAKGSSLTLHYRGRPELAGEVIAFAQRQASRSGLQLRTAKMSVELSPPLDVDRGTVVAERAAGMESVCYLGDDVADLAAFAVLDELERQGANVVRVAVQNQETPRALLEAADLHLGAPDDVVALLGQLAP